MITKVQVSSIPVPTQDHYSADTFLSMSHEVLIYLALQLHKGKQGRMTQVEKNTQSQTLRILAYLQYPLHMLHQSKIGKN